MSNINQVSGDEDDPDCGVFKDGHYCGLAQHAGNAHQCLDCDEWFEEPPLSDVKAKELGGMIARALRSWTRDDVPVIDPEIDVFHVSLSLAYQSREFWNSKGAFDLNPEQIAEYEEMARQRQQNRSPEEKAFIDSWLKERGHVG